MSLNMFRKAYQVSFIVRNYQNCLINEILSSKKSSSERRRTTSVFQVFIFLMSLTKGKEKT